MSLYGSVQLYLDVFRLRHVGQQRKNLPFATNCRLQRKQFLRVGRVQESSRNLLCFLSVIIALWYASINTSSKNVVLISCSFMCVLICDPFVKFLPILSCLVTKVNTLEILAEIALSVFDVVYAWCIFFTQSNPKW